MKGNRYHLVFIFALIAGISCSPARWDVKNEYTGWTSAIYGNTAAVSTMRLDRSGGSLHIFELNGGVWEYVQEIKIKKYTGLGIHRGPISIQMNDRFMLLGIDVAKGYPGRVQFFVRDTKGFWKYVKTFKAPQPMGDDQFGFVMKLVDDHVAITGDNGFKDNQAYIYKLYRDKVEYLVSARDPVGDQFTAYGEALDFSMDALVVSDSFWNHIRSERDSPGSGAVYVYSFAGSQSSLKQTINDFEPFSDEDNHECYGQRVHIDGKKLLVISRFNVFSFLRTEDGTYQFAQRLFPPDIELPNIASFKNNVMQGDIFILKVNFFRKDERVAVFRFKDSRWTLTDMIPHNIAGARYSDSFGESLAIDGDRVIIGHLGDDPYAPYFREKDKYMGKAYIVKLLPGAGYELEAEIGYQDIERKKTMTIKNFQNE